MNPLDLLLLRNGSEARLRAGSSHAISTSINEMMDQIPENNPKPGQIVLLGSRADEYQYVALSYIWGTKKMLMTERSNLTELQKEQALSTGPLAQQVARTIRDSIELVKLLGERYLWVDALCIVQDDGASKHHQITNMSSIYAAAKLTIISAQAADAWHGLQGLENISEPRSLHIRNVSAGGYRFVERLEYTTGLMPWCRRGWTFQEALFSPRRLIFSNDSVQWSCGTVVWTEDLDYDHKPRLLGSGWGVIGEEVLNTTFPDITGLNQLVETYGTRQFTFAEDTLSAFAGFSTAVSNIFLGGFIQGLPIMFLDAALLWKSNPHTQWPQPGSANKIYRKVPSKAQGECPPTWSWAGWATEVDYSSWIGASDYIRYSKTMRFYSDGCRTEPLVQCPGEDYDFVNILWVEWVDGIAYRKGLGRIFQHVWERQPLEDTELILG
ncbi:HET domain-containing protein [Fusarium sp. Ph1]|nr:HET domain-containing protein [Fusarium sp. Ph1]